jgi:serine/threonine protein kinase
MSCAHCGAVVEAGVSYCPACDRAVGARAVPGSLIASRYLLMAELGAGGMGVVFKAQDRALDEVVALKLLRGSPPTEGGGTPAERRAAQASRFRSEIKLAWRVRHRNVCGLHEYGEDGDLLYISMEFVEGRDLRSILHESGPMSWEDAYPIALQIADGLAAIHEAGIIHRDLKPANVMKDTRGVVRLLDFGIAKPRGGDASSDLTQSGRVVGSPEYMSPEQVRDAPVSFGSDIYSFGVVLYEMFTGRPPFKADTPVGTMLKHLEEPLPLDRPEAGRIPSALMSILRRALSKDPEDRYATCAAMRRALKEAESALESDTTEEVPMRPNSAWSRGASVTRLLLPQLLQALRHAEADVRLGAAQALGSVDADKDVVVRALRDVRAADEDPRVRAASEAALARLGT